MSATLSKLDLSILDSLPDDHKKAMLALLGQTATLAAQEASKSAANSRTIKLNSSGGVFVRDSLFKAWSSTKNKHYTASANLPMEVAQHLFGASANKELVAELGKFVDANKPK